MTQKRTSVPVEMALRALELAKRQGKRPNIAATAEAHGIYRSTLQRAWDRKHGKANGERRCATAR